MRNISTDRRRRSTRLADHDYGAFGTHFTTLCTKGRECLLGDVVGGQVVPSIYGEIVRQEWWQSAVLREELGLDAFVIMPNHIHTIVSILNRPRNESVGAHGRAPLLGRPPRSLGSFIAGFKAATTRRINILRDTPGAAFWQRNYWERIIRDEDEMNRIRQYIIENPMRWEEDQENPAARVAISKAKARR